MTRRDFELIAEVLLRAHELANGDEHLLVNEITEEFARVLAPTNPELRARFLKAAGVAS